MKEKGLLSLHEGTIFDPYSKDWDYMKAEKAVCFLLSRVAEGHNSLTETEKKEILIPALSLLAHVIYHNVELRPELSPFFKTKKFLTTYSAEDMRELLTETALSLGCVAGAEEDIGPISGAVQTTFRFLDAVNDLLKTLPHSAILKHTW